MAANSQEADGSAAMVRANMRLTTQQDAALMAEVEAGHYPNKSEAIRHAITEMYLREGDDGV